MIDVNRLRRQYAKIMGDAPEESPKATPPAQANPLPSIRKPSLNLPDPRPIPPQKPTKAPETQRAPGIKPWWTPNEPPATPEAAKPWWHSKPEPPKSPDSLGAVLREVGGIAHRLGFRAPEPPQEEKTLVDPRYNLQPNDRNLVGYEAPDDPWWHDSPAPLMVESQPDKVLQVLAGRTRPGGRGTLTGNVTQIQFRDPDGTVWKGWAKGAKNEYVQAGGAGTGRHTIAAGALPEREVSAWEISQVLGMGDYVPPVVLRSFNDDRWSVQKDTEGEAAELSDSKFGTPSESEMMAAFDWVIGNLDRHGSNWHLTRGGKIRLIDHGLSFPENHDDDFGQSDFVRNAYRKGLRVPTYAADWREKWPDIEKIMRRNSMSDLEIQRLKDRMDYMGNMAGRTFKELVDGSDFKAMKGAM